MSMGTKLLEQALAGCTGYNPVTRRSDPGGPVETATMSRFSGEYPWLVNTLSEHPLGTGYACTRCGAHVPQSFDESALTAFAALGTQDRFVEAHRNCPMQAPRLERVAPLPGTEGPPLPLTEALAAAPVCYRESDLLLLATEAHQLRRGEWINAVAALQREYPDGLPEAVALPEEPAEPAVAPRRLPVRMAWTAPDGVQVLAVQVGDDDPFFRRLGPLRPGGVPPVDLQPLLDRPVWMPVDVR